MIVLQDRTSRSLDLSAQDIDEIVKTMNVMPFKLLLNETWAPPGALKSARQKGYFEAMQDVEDAEANSR
jgi:ribonuclease I